MFYLKFQYVILVKKAFKMNLFFIAKNLKKLKADKIK